MEQNSLSVVHSIPSSELGRRIEDVRLSSLVGGRPPSSPVSMPARSSVLEADVGQLSDAQLVDGVAHHSHGALAEIYRRHSGEMHRLARRLRGLAADDVVQDVFLRLWDRPWLFDSARGSLRWFLMMQTRTQAIDLLRSESARRARETTVAVHRPMCPAVDDGAMARLAGEDAWLLVSQLRDVERSAITLAYFGDHSYREVALLLGLPEGTIKTRIRIGLGRLRHLMLASAPISSPNTDPLVLAATN